MKVSECFRLGTFVRTHGIKGALVLHIDADHPGLFNDLKEIFVLKNDRLLPMQVDEMQRKGATARFRLEGIDHIEDAASLKGCAAYLPLSMLPDPGVNRFYIHETFGFEVHDVKLGMIGIFENIIEFPHQKIARVVNSKKEILIPMVNEFIMEIDRNKKIILMRLPDGLTDL